MTDEELNQYADTTAALRSTGTDHLQSCPQCRDRAHQILARQRKLDSLREFASTSPAADCPDNYIWARIAVGAISEEDAAAELVHAAICSRCAGRLRIAIEDRDADLDEHESLIDSLPSSTQKGMARQAQRLAKASRSGSKPFVKRATVWLAAAAILVLADTSILVKRPNPADVNVLLTVGYESGRDLELRLPGADYTPLSKDRHGYATAPSEARSESPAPISGLPHLVSERQEVPQQIRDFMAKTRALGKAWAKIRHELQQYPHDGRWLDLRGRAELVAEQYDQAIPDLEKARALLSGDASVLGDLAAAYFERGKARHTQPDYESALRYLNLAIERDSKNAALHFNRAIVFGYLGRYREESSEWDVFLSLEPTGGWADEARTRQIYANAGIGSPLQLAPIPSDTVLSPLPLNTRSVSVPPAKRRP